MITIDDGHNAMGPFKVLRIGAFSYKLKGQCCATDDASDT